MHIIKLHLFCALQKAPRNKIVSRCLHLLIFGPEVPAGRWEEQGNNRILRNSVHNKILSMDSVKVTVTYFLDVISFHQFLLLSISIELN
ncbi:hypothetical protein BRADI_2g26125v3 [Brachypodium distachyon]|uniref:Uncharacterized protein n=1 Tax=Brachypodium distachyon TaxID=15368 RepID=A0A0Q3J149_BRADI|nr:hypothetical protein BRADI_2g26125v3 [Brachypodium distachyon]